MLQGIKRLYSTKDIDRKKELRKLNHSILVNFLDLIDILIKCPESPRREEKVEDINLLFIHMHHLVNEFRPHQVSDFKFTKNDLFSQCIIEGTRNVAGNADGAEAEENPVYPKVQRAFREGGGNDSGGHREPARYRC